MNRPTPLLAMPGDPERAQIRQAFDAFRRSVRRSETLDDGREAMKQLVVEAKEVGELANVRRPAERDQCRTGSARTAAVPSLIFLAQCHGSGHRHLFCGEVVPYQ